jgi:hypothetical protein
MALNKDQLKKSSDILEKLGVTLLIASIGDMVVGKLVGVRIIWDVLGVIWGLILMIISVVILGEIRNDK